MNGKRMNFAAWAAALTALALCMVSATGYAISPEKYKSELEENVEDYSGTKSWRKLAGQLCADKAEIYISDGVFEIMDSCGGDYLATDVASVSISGEVSDGEITRLDVRVKPKGATTREFENQAFSLSEIAFRSLIDSDDTDSDMSSYLFLYDVYPYALWARDSEFGDNARSISTALGDMNYSIDSTSALKDHTIEISINVRGAASDDDRAAAMNNLYANYALESICSLVYELTACKDTCSQLIKEGDSGDAPDELMGDMSSCASEYYALDAQNYPKLSKLTALLSPQFDSMVSAINSLKGEVSKEQVDALENAIDAMNAALKTMY